MSRRFPLRVELVPEPLWKLNLRSNQVGLGPRRWLKLSREVRATLAQCAICGTRQRRLHGHEVWGFAETPRSGVARLLKVNAICVFCHSIQHWGMTQELIRQGVLSVADERRLIAHFVKVNRCEREAFYRHVVRAFAQHRQRSRKKWKIDWGQFGSAIAEAKAARERWHQARA